MSTTSTDIPIEDTNNILLPERDMNIDRSTSLSILKQYAEAITNQTEGIIEGEISTVKVGQENNTRLFHTFYLQAPELDNYRFQLFTVVQMLSDLYPVSIVEEITRSAEEAGQEEGIWIGSKFFGNQYHNEAEFKHQLNKLFNHYRTQNILDSLIIQSKEAKEMLVKR
jgi:hypothetical protein